MSIAYLILAHHQPRQLVSLVQAIRRQSQSPVLIHFDAKSRMLHSKALSELESLPDVVVVSTRAVSWGGFSIVQAALDGLAEILRRWPCVSHVKHLSGQDYPIRPLRDFELYAARLGERSAMEYWTMPSEHWGDEGGMERVNRVWLYKGKRRFYLPFARRSLPSDVTFHGGNAFWCLSRPHIEYIMAQSGRLVEILTKSFISDETYFQSIILNSSFRGDVENIVLTYTAWKWMATGPNVLTQWDLPEMAASGAFFARKLEPFLSSELMEELDRRNEHSA